MFELVVLIDETDIVLQFCDVNAKCLSCHGDALLMESDAARVKLAECKLGSSVSGFGYCPTFVRCTGGCRELVQPTDSMWTQFKRSFSGILCGPKLDASANISQHTNSGVRHLRDYEKGYSHENELFRVPQSKRVSDFMDESTEESETTANSTDKTPADFIELIDALNEQGWDLKKSDTKRMLELAMQARQLAEANSYERGLAYSLRSSGHYHFLMGEYKSGLSEELGALALFERLEDKRGIASALNCLINIYNALGEGSKAIESHSRSLQICEELNDKSEASRSFNNIGGSYFQLGDYAKALASWQQCLRLQAEINEQSTQSTLSNLGVVYNQLGEYEKAADYYLEALQRSREARDLAMESVCLPNLGETYMLMGNYETALEYMVKGIEVSQKIDNRYAEGGALIHLGALYRMMGKFKEAMDSYQKGLGLFRQIGNRQWESKALISLGELFNECGDYAQAADTLSEALVIAEQTVHNEYIFKAHYALSQTYERQEDFAQALEHYKAFFTFRQKVFSEEADKNLKRVMVQFEVEKTHKEAEIHQLKHVELVARVRELEEALAQIKQLQSLLPICSYCKSIRGDENYWQSVESYVSQHTDTQFSHSICPACYEKELRPQIEKMRMRRKLSDSN